MVVAVDVVAHGLADCAGFGEGEADGDDLGHEVGEWRY